MPTMPLVGDELAGYRLMGVAGRGGMSVVYRAENPRLGSVVALKVLAPEISMHDLFRTRFLQESRVAASLSHPNVIPIYDMGSHGDLLYIAMRYVSGHDMRDLMRTKRPLPPDEALHIVGQGGRALDHAHQHSLVHRDVKPANLLVEPGVDDEDSDHVFLADFGITKHALSRTGLTPTGQFMGTLDYVAPEQIQGKEVGPSADIYSLGCVLYEGLTGHVPFVKDIDVAVLWAHVEDPPPAASSINPALPAAIDDVLTRALQKNPEDRYPTCRQMVSEARVAFAHDDQVTARPRPVALQRHAPVEQSAVPAVPPDVDQGERPGESLGAPQRPAKSSRDPLAGAGTSSSAAVAASVSSPARSASVDAPEGSAPGRSLPRGHRSDADIAGTGPSIPPASRRRDGSREHDLAEPPRGREGEGADTPLGRGGSGNAPFTADSTRRLAGDSADEGHDDPRPPNNSETASDTSGNEIRTRSSWTKVAIAAAVALVVAAVAVLLAVERNPSGPTEGNEVPLAQIVPAFGHFGPNGGLTKALKTCGLASVPGEDYQDYNCSFADKYGPFDLELTEKDPVILNTDKQLPEIVRHPPINTIVTTEQSINSYHAYFLEWAANGEDAVKNTPDDEVTLTLYDVDPRHPGAAKFTARDSDSRALTRKEANRLLTAIGASDKSFALPKIFRFSALKTFAEPFVNSKPKVHCEPAFIVISREYEHVNCRDGDVNIGFGLVDKERLESVRYRYRGGDNYDWTNNADRGGHLIMLRFGTWTRLYWDQDDGQAWGVLSTKTRDGTAQDPLQNPLMAYFKAFQGDDITVKRAGMSRSWWSN